MTFGYKVHKNIKKADEKTHPIAKEAFQTFIVMIGAVLVALGLELFLVPNDFLDGGVTGLSIILSHFFKLPLGVFIAILNLPFMILSFIYLGKKTSIKAILGISTLAITTILLHNNDPVTTEFTLALGYGGLLVGAGIGLALRYGGALDGTEALAVIISKKTNFDIEQIILFVNLIIFFIAAFAINPESAMASLLLYYIIVTPIISKVMEGGNEMKIAQIITTDCQKVSETIHNEINRKVIISSAHRTSAGDTQSDDISNVKILTVIIARIEENLITAAIEETDPNAIIIFQDAAAIHGGVFRKNTHH